MSRATGALAGGFLPPTVYLFVGAAIATVIATLFQATMGFILLALPTPFEVAAIVLAGYGALMIARRDDAPAGTRWVVCALVVLWAFRIQFAQEYLAGLQGRPGPLATTVRDAELGVRMVSTLAVIALAGASWRIEIATPGWRRVAFVALPILAIYGAWLAVMSAFAWAKVPLPLGAVAPFIALPMRLAFIVAFASFPLLALRLALRGRAEAWTVVVIAAVVAAILIDALAPGRSFADPGAQSLRTQPIAVFKQLWVFLQPPALFAAAAAAFRIGRTIREA